MAQNLKPRQKPDVIIPIPLHPSRQRVRGFNQTRELSREISKIWSFPIELKRCQRVLNTASQSGLSAKARVNNISTHSFKISSDFQAKNVLIIEDVVTTGATVKSFCYALKSAGVENIEIWACCRTGI